VSGHLILLVDDEVAIRRLARGALQRAGYRTSEAGTAREALDQAAADRPALVLLDLGLPDRDGLELIGALQRTAAVIVVSAREAVDEKVAALDLGADDYVTKPFDTEELVARIRVALRHRLRPGGAGGPIAAGDVVIDLDRRLVTRGGVEVHLTRKEFDVMAELARAPGRVVTHERILAAVWPGSYDRPVEYLRLVVRNLRQKLEADPAAPALFVNELGVGYRLVAGLVD
jgi:two-component system KDP operon response regulator KdpE